MQRAGGLARRFAWIKQIPVHAWPSKWSYRGFVQKSGPRLIGSLVRCAALAAVTVCVAGCGMSSLTSGIGGGWFGGSKSVKSESTGVSEDQLLAAAKTDTGSISNAGTTELAFGCPRFQVWTRDGFLTVYEQGRVGDGLAVMHRGEISKTARECHIEGNRITVKYGFSGRVLLGPKGRNGVVTMPLNVFVADAKREKVVNDPVQVRVDVAVDKPIGYFSVVRTVTFTVPEGSRPAEFELFVGFDRNVPGAG